MHAMHHAQKTNHHQGRSQSQSHTIRGPITHCKVFAGDSHREARPADEGRTRQGHTDMTSSAVTVSPAVPNTGNKYHSQSKRSKHIQD